MNRLVVDGYNVLHRDPELTALADAGQLERARDRLIDRLAEFAARSRVAVTIVFDSHRADGAPQRELRDGVTVVYGTSRQSADHLIERMAHEATRHGPDTNMVVATDDHLQRDVVVAMGVAILGSSALLAMLEQDAADRAEEADERSRHAAADRRIEARLDPKTRAVLERWRRGDPPA